jgi:hypothetical protein
MNPFMAGVHVDLSHLAVVGLMSLRTDLNRYHVSETVALI